VETVIFPERLARQIRQQALASPAVEICGLVAASHGQPQRCIPVPNIADRPAGRFAMDPAYQIDTLRTMREQGEALFAIYHSHPNSPAEPSPTDLEEAAYPDALTIIVSLDSSEAGIMRGFRLKAGKATEVRLMIATPTTDV